MPTGVYPRTKEHLKKMSAALKGFQLKMRLNSSYLKPDKERITQIGKVLR